MVLNETCPCGSRLSYPTCCGKLHSGSSYAETAVQLMRSRYSAYVLKLVDYIYATTHPEKQSAALKQQVVAWTEQVEFYRLEIIAQQKGEKGDKVGKVEFVANYRQFGKEREQHELSRFKRFKKRWYYFDGEFNP